jgi:hypothetical protein
MSTQPNLETDPRFPSGPWTGYFLQRLVPGRHLMELGLTFRQGEMTGEGRDWVGDFIVRGRYDLADGRCHFTKRYLAKHDVFYQGFNEGKGIWGTWEIARRPDQIHQKGGFHIWPVGMADPTGSSLSEAASPPMLLEEMPELKPSEMAPTGERILEKEGGPSDADNTDHPR